MEISLMVFGRQGLTIARGNEVEEMKNERAVRVGRGLVVVAASFGNRSFALLPVVIPPSAAQMTIHAEDGLLRVGEAPGKRSKPSIKP